MNQLINKIYNAYYEHIKLAPYFIAKFFHNIFNKLELIRTILQQYHIQGKMYT